MPGLPVLLALPNGSRLKVWLQIVPQLALFENRGTSRLEGVKKSVFCLQIENLSWRCFRYC